MGSTCTALQFESAGTPGGCEATPRNESGRTTFSVTFPINTRIQKLALAVWLNGMGFKHLLLPDTRVWFGAVAIAETPEMVQEMRALAEKQVQVRQAMATLLAANETERSEWDAVAEGEAEAEAEADATAAGVRSAMRLAVDELVELRNTMPNDSYLRLSNALKRGHDQAFSEERRDDDDEQSRS